MTVRKSERRVVARLHTHDLGDHDYIDLLCLGDFHIGDEQADLTLVHDAMMWLEAEPNRYGVIAGDVLNMATRNSVSFEYGRMHPGEARKLATTMLRRAKDKILGVVTGNHDSRGEKETGIDPLEWVCTELGIPYFDSEAIINIKVGHYRNLAKTQTQKVSYGLYMAHGCRGGRKTGSKLNGLMDYREVVPNADVYIGGHGHDPIIKPDVSYMMDLRNGNLVEQEQMFVVCGSSLKRIIGQGYAAAKAYRPLAQVFPIVRLDGRAKKITARTGD